MAENAPGLSTSNLPGGHEDKAEGQTSTDPLRRIRRVLENYWDTNGTQVDFFVEIIDVSCAPTALLTGKFTGNFSILAPFPARGAKKLLTIQQVTD
jgi:hypothetical protein